MSGPLPRSGSPRARVARGAAAAAPNEILLNVKMGRNARQHVTQICIACSSTQLHPSALSIDFDVLFQGGVTGGGALPDVAWPAARSAALWAFCRRQNAPEGRLYETYLVAT